jgi:membrane-bound acyltransferase YfiQ involved in biofilm formation
MLSFLKKYFDWFVIAFHGVVLSFALFVSITNMDISGWIFVFFVAYFCGMLLNRLLRKINSKKSQKK